MNQTISTSFSFIGRTLRTNERVRVTCEPYDRGIAFMVNGVLIPANYKFIDPNETGLTTTLINRDVRVVLTEHILAAFWGMGIDNVLIRMNKEETPFCASCELFTKKIKKAGTTYVASPPPLVVKERQVIAISGDRYIEVQPYPKFCVATFLDYDNLLATQVAHYNIEQDFIKEVSWARTCLAYPLDESGELWHEKRKEFNLLPKDWNKSQYIIYTDSRFITPMKAPNEVARHKILDILGDFSLLGREIIGKIVGFKPGHALNRQAVCKLADLV